MISTTEASTDVVLIHGGSTTGGYWDRLRPLIEHRTIAPDLPGRRDRPADLFDLTVDDCVTSVIRDLDRLDLAPRVVLMAHSSGGLTVPGVARHLGDRLAHIVLSSASVPPNGGNGLDCMLPRHAAGCRALQAKVRRDGSASIDLRRRVDPEAIRTAYGGDPLSDEIVEYMCAPERRVPESFNVYFQPVTWGGVRDVGITWLLNLRDRVIPIELQRTMIGRLPTAPHIVETDAGHIPSVTHPELVAGTVARAATS